MAPTSHVILEIVDDRDNVKTHALVREGGLTFSFEALGNLLTFHEYFFVDHYRNRIRIASDFHQMDAGLLSGEGTDLTVVHFSLEFHLAKERPGIFIQKQ